MVEIVYTWEKPSIVFRALGVYDQAPLLVIPIMLQAQRVLPPGSRCFHDCGTAKDDLKKR